MFAKLKIFFLLSKKIKFDHFNFNKNPKNGENQTFSSGGRHSQRCNLDSAQNPIPAIWANQENVFPRFPRFSE